MDDKTLNLWRQIEGCRRTRRLSARRARPAAIPGPQIGKWNPAGGRRGERLGDGRAQWPRARTDPAVPCL